MKTYQKTLSALLLIGTVFYTIGCKKSNNDAETTTPYICATCVVTPDAKVENNSISKGIYKGVVTGSTGNITIDVLNSGTTAKIIFILDGTTINLITVTAWVAGAAYNADFTGTFGGQTYTLRFTVDASGTNPAITSVSVPGHPTIGFQLYKETSDNLIKAYEGTTDGVKDNGTVQGSVLNIVTSGKASTWIGLSKDNASSAISISGGTITGSTINCNCGPTTTVTGTITADDLIGTYKGSDNHGTFKAKRTL